jgi:hypothetical protein
MGLTTAHDSNVDQFSQKTKKKGWVLCRYEVGLGFDPLAGQGVGATVNYTGF